MYVLKSNIYDIAQSIEKQGYAFGNDALKEANLLIKICPNELLINVDEIVTETSLSDISVYISVNGKNKAVTVNEIAELYNNIPPLFMILKAICLELTGENGLLNLHIRCQGL